MQWDPTLFNTIIRTSKDEYKLLNFSVAEDTFIRINTTAFRKGKPEFGDGVNPNRFYYVDSRKMTCYDLIDPILNKTVDNHTMYYYYLPEGEYRTLIYNTDQSQDGLLMISSQIIENAGTDIPVNSLSPSNSHSTHFTTVEFGWDDYFHSLKEAKWISVNIPDQGQFKLNTTVTAEDNLAGIYKRHPNLLYRNLTKFEYGEEMFINDPYSQGDVFYIASHSRYTGLEFLIDSIWPITTGAISLSTYSGSNIWDVIPYNDHTENLKHDGVIEFDISHPFFESWVKGCDIDFPNITNENLFYWLRINCTSRFYNLRIPRVNQIYLLNVTLSGDLNFALIKESPYENCDFWETYESVSGGLDINGLRFGRDEDPTTKGTLRSDSESRFILNDKKPYTIGFERGDHKLLVVPENWSHNGHVNIRFAVEDYWERNARSWYNVTNEPIAHGFKITKNPGDDPNLYGYIAIPFDHVVGFNSSLYNWTTSNYYVMSCYGEKYKWTQLVVYKDWISKYNLYLMQDIPWINNDGPNNEVMKLADGVVANGSVFEFGVLNSFFALIFEFNSTEDMVRFRLAVSQYATPFIRASNPLPSVSSGLLISSNTLVFSLSILALTGIGAMVTTLIIKKRQ
jgi:hypothetical protein